MTYAQDYEHRAGVVLLDLALARGRQLGTLDDAMAQPTAIVAADRAVDLLKSIVVDALQNGRDLLLGLDEQSEQVLERDLGHVDVDEGGGHARL